MDKETGESKDAGRRELKIEFGMRLMK